MTQRYYVIKDEDGILRPSAYIEREETHAIQKHPKLEDGEQFVLVTLEEVKK